MNKKQRRAWEQVKPAFVQPPRSSQPVAATPDAPKLPTRNTLTFRRAKLYDFIGFDGRNWVDSVSGRVYESIDLALKSAYQNIQALGGDYQTPLRELRRLFREAKTNA